MSMGKELEPPELDAYEFYIWQGFRILATSRPSGMDIGAISFSESFLFWRDFKGLVGEDLEEALHLTRFLDVVYLNHIQKEQARKTGKS